MGKEHWLEEPKMKRLMMVWLAGVALLGFELTALSFARGQAAVETAAMIETPVAVETTAAVP